MKTLSRRIFLKAGFLLSSLLMFPSVVRAFFVNRFPVRTVERDTFRFDPATGLVRQDSRSEAYRLEVGGLVEKAQQFSYADLKAFPQTTQVSDFHCVEGWSVGDIQWGGIRFEEILKRVHPKPEAKYAVFHALGKTGGSPAGLDHYVESLPLVELLDKTKACLLALYQDGKPLTLEHGAPLRLVSPFDLGYKSIKYVTRIEFTGKQPHGWWTSANAIYPVNAPVPKSRLR
jgi:DMSO/TMAO reductase YedYZ molybdopterin-dependent catalytic subunit